MHSGDSACAIPPPNLSSETQEVIIEYTKRLAERLEVVGLLNVQFAVKQGQVFVIEANPRASRTVPFVAKATGVQLAKVAARVMAGETLEDLRARSRRSKRSRCVGKRYFHFSDSLTSTLLGPEMRSTGEALA